MASAACAAVRDHLPGLCPYTHRSSLSTSTFFFRGSSHTRGFLYNSRIRRTDILVLRSHQTCLLFIYIVSGGRSFAHLSLGEGEALTRVPGDLIRVNPFGRLHNSSQSIKTAFSSENPEKVPSHCSIVSPRGSPRKKLEGRQNPCGADWLSAITNKIPAPRRGARRHIRGRKKQGGEDFQLLR